MPYQIPIPRIARVFAIVASLLLAVTSRAISVFAAPVPVSVTITYVGCTQEDECRNAGIEAAGESWPDFYAKIFINGVETITTRAPDDNSPVSPFGWTAGATIDDSVTPNVPITIQIWDHDSTSGDDLADSSPQADHNNTDLVLNLATGTWSGDTTNRCVTGDGVDTEDTEYYPVKVCFDISIRSTTGDLDSDGLLDGWETVGFDADNDGVIDINLPSMGARVDHKDIFLELDYEATRPPTRDGIAAMKAAFAAAPLPNPDGTSGIALHVDVGNLVDPTADEAHLAGTCTNGIDDDGDGLVDGADTSCIYLESSREVGVGNCANGLDDDGDGLADRADPDCRVGDNLGGGQALPPQGTCGLNGNNNAFYATRAANFDPRRLWIFHYALQGAASPTSANPTCQGGQGERGGNDFVTHNLDAGTIMHELGHNLNLQHGGQDPQNCKPNYLSVMNYNTQSGIPRSSTAVILDYSPPRITLNGSKRATAPLAVLNEGSLNENNPIDPADPVNRVVFMNGLNQIARVPANLPHNYNGDADPPFDNPVAVNIDNGIPAVPGIPGTFTAGAKPAVGAPACANAAFTTLNGANDWNAVVLAFRQFGDNASGAINPSDETGSPTEEDLQRMADQGRTTDLIVSLAASPNPVASGTDLSLHAEVRNAGPNPAGAVWLTASVPPGTQRTGPLSPNCSEPSPGTLHCGFGEMMPGAVQALNMTARVAPDLVYNAGAPLGITALAKVEDRAGIEAQPADNTVSITVTAVAVANLGVRDLAVQRPPLRMRTGESVVVHLQSTISSGGPSSPMDARTTLTAKADAGASVTPTWLESFDRAVTDGETRTIDDWLIITCQERGRHRYDFAQGIAPHRAPDTDPDTSNDRFNTTLEVDCSGREQVVVNLMPGTFPNIVVLDSRETRLAILSTRPGEYGRASHFDARWIDPTSIRVGSRRMIAGSEPGGTRFSEPRLVDAPEKITPETTLDGDEDLFVDTINLSDAGLHADDSEACVMGTYTDPATGGRAEFYGCDSILVRR